MIQQGITTTRISSEGEIDRSAPKIFIIALFGLALNVSQIYLFLRFVETFELRGFVFWFLAAVVFFVFVLIQTVFIKSGRKLLLISIVQALSSLIFFWRDLYPAAATSLLIGIAVYVFFISFGAHRGWAVLSNSVSIKFSLVSRDVLPKAAFGLVFFLCSVIFTFFQGQDSADRILKAAIHELSKSAAPVFSVWAPGVSFSQDVNTFLENVVVSKLKESSIEIPQGDESFSRVAFSKLPEQMKNQLVSDAVEKAKESLEAFLGPISGDILVEDAVFKSIQKYRESLSQTNKNLIGILILVSLFFVLRGVLALFYWFVTLLAFILFKFLVITGFAYIGTEERTRKFVLLS